MRMRMSKFMRISADVDPDAELRYTSNENKQCYIFPLESDVAIGKSIHLFVII